VKKSSRLESTSSSVSLKLSMLTFILLMSLLSTPPLAFAVRKDITKINLPKVDVAESGKLIRSGNLIVVVAQVKRLDEKHSNPRYCRAYVQVMNGKKMFTEYFDDINGLGGTFGLFVPKGDIPGGYRSIVKLGDYDGRLLLVRNDGKLWNLPGGSYFLSKDNQQLFSIHECDARTGLTIFDLKKGLVVFQTNEKAKSVPPIIDKWYSDGKQYFFTVKTEDGSTPKGDQREVFAYDNNARKLVKKTVSSKQLNSAETVSYQFDALSEKDLQLAQLDGPEGKGKDASKETSVR
jgi:hypothetical protein